MSLHHYRLLETLADRNGQPMGDLASRLLIDGPTLTKIVNRMVASAEVYRGPDPHDRRKVLIFLSRRGAARFGDISELGISIQQAILGGLGASEAAALTTLLSKLMACSVLPLSSPESRTRDGDVRMT
ncbi:MarR family winged helix-turn-helix transcriptional regulator [Bradyrhizobium sp. 186]|nr:MarR family winged helix-turn-helix transcriptional regulator [Bradyrhizobium sp. 186]